MDTSAERERKMRLGMGQGKLSCVESSKLDKYNHSCNRPTHGALVSSIPLYCKRKLSGISLKWDESCAVSTH